MKNWKDKVLGIFAGIGVMTLFMASNSQQPNISYGTPESHVWEFHSELGLSINKQTGEIRKHNTTRLFYNNENAEKEPYGTDKYVVLKEEKL